MVRAIVKCDIYQIFARISAKRVTLCAKVRHWWPSLGLVRGLHRPVECKIGAAEELSA